MHDKPDLHSLIDGVRNGSAEAFSQLYDLIAKPVYVIAYRITGNREQAEDITQEILLQIWVSPPDKSVRKPRAWIFRMVHNRALDALRRQQPDALPDTLPDRSDLTDTLLTRTALEAACAALEPDEREILSMRIDAELTYQEIAQATQRSAASVFRCYQRTLRKLRAALEEE